MSPLPPDAVVAVTGAPRLRLMVAVFVADGKYSDIRRHEWAGPMHPLAVPTPPGAFAVQFYQQPVCRVEVDAPGGSVEEVLVGDAVWVGPLTYVRGKLMHVRDIAREYDLPNLVRRLDEARKARAVIFGSFSTAFEDGDVFVGRYRSLTADGAEPVTDPAVLAAHPYPDATE